MIDIRRHLSLALMEAVKNSGWLLETQPGVTPCHDPRFGDYQTNLAMLLAKFLGKPPREVAQTLMEKLQGGSLCRSIDLAGAGFINFHLHDQFVHEQLEAMARDPRQGILPVERPRRIVIDFSSPNIAKSMHVGHIRSTFLGDSLARVARAVGHHVVTDNHLGDWGTQFGKLIYGYKKMLRPGALGVSPLLEFERLYKEVEQLSKTNEEVLLSARQELAKLQAGDAENLKIWKQISEQSLLEFNKAYSRMGVTFDHVLGESFYNPQLSRVVDELRHLGIAQESEGAVCIFFADDSELKDTAPMIIQKSDGAALYATTDLATVLYRVEKWQAEEILYVTDARQQLHFKQLFAAVQRWFRQRNMPSPRLRHIIFGSILGGDKKPIKTRSGESIKLAELLDEAEARTLKIIQEKNPQMPLKVQQETAKVIGVGALKYADLCQNRNLDYVFDWNKLLALHGNTAPYLIYAYVRIRSIFQAANLSEAEVRKFSFHLGAAEEISLAKHLIQFSDAVHSILEDDRPHLLATYLYELAVRYSKFYEVCPVLKASERERNSRLKLCDLVAQTLKKGLDLLGIETVEEM